MCYQQCMRSKIKVAMLDSGRCRVFAEIVIALPVSNGPDRTRDKPTAAIWTDVAQKTVDAIGTESTFIAADARLQRIRRQCFVAMFASWTKLEHEEVTLIAW